MKSLPHWPVSIKKLLQQNLKQSKRPNKPSLGQQASKIRRNNINNKEYYLFRVIASPEDVDGA
jgi:hypothetical protein